MLPEEPAASGHDLLFYGYDGFGTRARVSALLLRQMLEALHSAPAAVFANSLPGAPPRAPAFAYDTTLVVAHSLGAVVARQALIDATRLGRPWAGTVRQLFFAPAHMGADIAELARAAWFGFLPRLALTALRVQAPVLLDLEPGSQMLDLLQRDVAQLQAASTNSHLSATHTVLAGRDRVVSPNGFPGDPVPALLGSASHTSVCKPHSQFPDPLLEVLPFL